MSVVNVCFLDWKFDWKKKISLKIITDWLYTKFVPLHLTFLYALLLDFLSICARELIGECAECLRDDILRDLDTICTFGSRSKGHWVHFHSKKHAIWTKNNGRRRAMHRNWWFFLKILWISDQRLIYTVTVLICRYLCWMIRNL